MSPTLGFSPSDCAAQEHPRTPRGHRTTAHGRSRSLRSAHSAATIRQLVAEHLHARDTPDEIEDLDLQLSQCRPSPACDWKGGERSGLPVPLDGPAVPVLELGVEFAAAVRPDRPVPNRDPSRIELDDVDLPTVIAAPQRFLAESDVAERDSLHFLRLGVLRLCGIAFDCDDGLPWIVHAAHPSR